MKTHLVFGTLTWARLPFLAAVILLAGHAFADPEAASRYSLRHGELALVIWSNGRLLVERNAGTPRNTFSITKSLCALGTLEEIGRGRLSLDEPAGRTLQEWQRDPRKRQVTIRQLLEQTSGLATAYETLYARGLRSLDATVLQLPVECRPGECFAYGPSHYETLGAIFSRKSLPPPLPPGIQPANWRTDRRGRPYFSAGAWVTANDLLKAGHLVRRKGWAFVFPAIAPHLMRAAVQGSRANPSYGMGLWLNRNATRPDAVERDIEEAISSSLSRTQWATTCLSRRAPADLVAMVGSYGQRVYVSSRARLVVVRFGTGSAFRDPDFLREYFR